MTHPTDANRSQEATEANEPSIEEQGERFAQRLEDTARRLTAAHGTDAANTYLRLMLACSDSEISEDEAMALAHRFREDWQSVRAELAEKGAGERLTQK